MRVLGLCVKIGAGSPLFSVLLDFFGREFRMSRPAMDAEAVGTSPLSTPRSGSAASTATATLLGRGVHAEDHDDRHGGMGFLGIALSSRQARYVTFHPIWPGSSVSTGIDRLTNTKVAIYKLPASGTQAAREFLTCSILGAHGHPNVQQLMDYFVTDGPHGAAFVHMVYPLADCTLWEIYAMDVDCQTSTPERIASLTGQMAAGLVHIHDLGLVHGAVALHHFLLDRGDRVRLADFRSAHAAHTILINQGNSAAYARAPEVIFGMPATAAGDVWSRGTCT